MFVSQMALDLTRPDTQVFVHSPKYAKKEIDALFSTRFPNLLWRIDYVNGRTWLVLLSPWRPNFDALHERIGFQGVFPSWHIRDLSEQLEDLQTGDLYVFDLCTSPLPPNAARNDAQITISFIYEWLIHMSKESGFQIESIRSISSNWQVVDASYILYAHIHGRLLITNPDTFCHTLLSGIGYAKDLGAGLLTIGQSNLA